MRSETTSLSRSARGRSVGALVAIVAACAITATAAPAASARNAMPAGIAAKAPAFAAKTNAFRFVEDIALFGHLPATSENVEVVSKLNLIHPETGQPVIQSQVADVAVHKGFAYLNSWDSATCEGGGTFVVDIRNPAQPRQVTFIPARSPSTTARAPTSCRSPRRSSQAICSPSTTRATARTCSRTAASPRT